MIEMSSRFFQSLQFLFRIKCAYEVARAGNVADNLSIQPVALLLGLYSN